MIDAKENFECFLGATAPPATTRIEGEVVGNLKKPARPPPAMRELQEYVESLN